MHHKSKQNKIWGIQAFNSLEAFEYRVREAADNSKSMVKTLNKQTSPYSNT